SFGLFSTIVGYSALSPGNSKGSSKNHFGETQRGCARNCRRACQYTSASSTTARHHFQGLANRADPRTLAAICSMAFVELVAAARAVAKVTEQKAAAIT